MANQPPLDTNHLIGLDGNIYNMITISSNLNLVIPVEDRSPDIVNIANNCRLTSTYAVIGNPCGQLRNLLLSLNPSSGGEPLFSTMKLEPDSSYKKKITLPTTDNTNVVVNTNINIPPSTVISLPKSDNLPILIVPDPILPTSIQRSQPSTSQDTNNTNDATTNNTNYATPSDATPSDATPSDAILSDITTNDTIDATDTTAKPADTFRSNIYPIETFGKSHIISFQFILIILSLVLIICCYYDKN